MCATTNLTEPDVEKVLLCRPFSVVVDGAPEGDGGDGYFGEHRHRPQRDEEQDVAHELEKVDMSKIRHKCH